MEANQRTILTILISAGVCACAHTPPKELVAARSAYEAASQGQTAQRAPVELHKAQVALHTAEQAFDDEPEGQVTKDLAYVALRKVQVADVTAVRAAQADVKRQAEQDLKTAKAQQASKTQGELAQAQSQLNATEQSAREAEARNAEMEQRLSELASVKEDERGTVLTLSGSLLFPSSKATLTPAAQRRLDEVSDALLTDKQRSIVIEGYTDSRGSDNFNMSLSQRRAEAVRNYLVSRGLEPTRVQAEGKGEAEPVASNADPEGRANNRRVEIVLEKAK